MGLFLRQDEQRSEVQQRVAAELQERMRQSTDIPPTETDPAMLDGNHTTRPAGMVIIILVVLLFIAVIAYAIRIS